MKGMYTGAPDRTTEDHADVWYGHSDGSVHRSGQNI
jgi:hypothetical protein